MVSFGGGQICAICLKTVYIAEQIVYDNLVYHAACFRCLRCSTVLSPVLVAKIEGCVYCKNCFNCLFKSGGGRYSTLTSAGENSVVQRQANFEKISVQHPVSTGTDNRSLNSASGKMQNSVARLAKMFEKNVSASQTPEATVTTRQPHQGLNHAKSIDPVQRPPVGRVASLLNSYRRDIAATGSTLPNTHESNSLSHSAEPIKPLANHSVSDDAINKTDKSNQFKLCTAEQDHDLETKAINSRTISDNEVSNELACLFEQIIAQNESLIRFILEENGLQLLFKQHSGFANRNAIQFALSDQRFSTSGSVLLNLVEAELRNTRKWSSKQDAAKI